MTSDRATRIAMPVAALMIAHQVAGKAVRDATFLSTWPISGLPAIVAATALLVVLLVPIYSRLIERYGPRVVVASGFLASAVAHLVEWRYASASSWTAVAIYLHIAGISGLLLSGFWSVLSERFDVQTARASFGRIAATGTIGGLAGGFIVARIAGMGSTTLPLLMLAVLHLGCAVGLAWLGDPPAGFSSVTGQTDRAGGVFGLSVLRRAPHLVALGTIVLLGAAGATIADYLLKLQAVQRIGTGAGLLEFFATFYMIVQVATFLAQFAVSANLRRFGIGATISTLPAGVGSIGALTLLYPTFPMAIVLRGAESVLRGSLFRSAYELIFVPMDPVEKRRAKTFLDVTCDRGGDAIGAGIVQLILLTSAAYFTSQLLAAMIVLAAVGVWLGRRLDALYLGIVERRLTTDRGSTPVLVPSETGWTVLDLNHISDSTAPSKTVVDRTPPPPAVANADPGLASLVELRSGDRQRIERALRALTDPKAVQLSQVIQLLAWNDIVPDARAVLERAAHVHVGLLTDALLDAETDFAIRRRIPRVLGTVSSQRAIDGLVEGLDDGRFEVRFQCSRAIVRLRLRDPALKVNGGRLMDVAERELSVSPAIWHGYRLIDSVEYDEAAVSDGSGQGQRNLEHLFALLSGTLPAGPLDVALRGIRSEDAGLRGVAIEYLESALPRTVWQNLQRLLDATPRSSGVDAPWQSDPPPPASPR